MYRVTYEMAMDLLKYYAEQLHVAERSKSLSPKHEERWVTINDKFINLITQMKLNEAKSSEEILEEIGNDILPRFTYKNITVYFDGASRGNHDVTEPNRAGIAFIVYADNREIYQYSEYIGATLHKTIGNFQYTSVATNNVAEYYALIKVLEYLIDNNLSAPEMVFKSDSTCVVNQVNLTNTTRAEHLLTLRNYAILLLKQFPDYSLVHVPRRYNQIVDDLVNKVLDENV
jgi:ribonuclease HI